MAMIADLLKGQEINFVPLSIGHHMKAYRRLIKIFSAAEDSRCKKKTKYLLSHLILMIFLAVLGGAQGYNEMQKFWEIHHKLYRKLFFVYDRVPSHDCFRHLLGVLKPEEMNKVLVEVLYASDNSLRMALGLQPHGYTHLCVDGKELRGTGVGLKDDGQTIRNLQSLNIYNTTSDICIMSKAIEEKTNEIPVAQELLGKMNLRNTIVTFDALHTQKKTISIIVSGKGDYLGGLKGNQGKILDEVISMFTSDKMQSMKGSEKNYLYAAEISHNQLEQREFYVMPLTLAQRKGKFSEWEGIKSIVCYMKTCTNNITGKINVPEIRYYISSLTDIEWITSCIRGHWGIENRVHNGLDTVFDEDSMKVEDRNAAMNRDLVYKACLALLRKIQDVKGVKGWVSKNTLRKCLGWDFEGQMSEVLTLLDPKILSNSLIVVPRKQEGAKN